MSVFVRSPYNYDADVTSFSSGLDCSGDPSMTQQQFRDEVDINVMVERFQRTGLPEAPAVPPGVQDFTDVHDFRSAMQVVVDARVAFSGLSSGIRARFHNDPAEYLAFVYDADNRAEAVKLGMIPAPPVEPDVPAVPDVSPAST